MVKYSTNKESFVIDDYQNSPPFSSFLPSIAGLKGIPLYAFYTNRGQGIASFGSDGKDGAIMDFYPANEIYRHIDRIGFRTFLKIDGQFSECFKTHDTKMTIDFDSLLIEEDNREQEYRIAVRYFTLPNESVNGLVREVTIVNTSNKKRRFETADGMPVINVFGTPHYEKKLMSYLVNSYNRCEEYSQKTILYKKSATTDDSANVLINEACNYFFSIDGEGKLLDKICDPNVIFGGDLSLENPVNFISGKECESLPFNKSLCAFSVACKNLGAGEKLKIISVFGKVKEKSTLDAHLQRFMNKVYFAQKFEENRRLTMQVANKAAIRTAYPVFDTYVKNCYLDNSLRGGMPVKIGNKVFYIYSRKHGDLERDYNNFSVKDEFFSCGNGNFRDVNQNRRLDNFFNKDVLESNIRFFYSLICLDGYNPLSVYPPKLKPSDELKKAKNLSQENYTPGELLELLGDEAEFEKAVTESGFVQRSEFAEGGYWADHFCYNLDLVENYLRLYPDKKHELLYAQDFCGYFRTGVRVMPNSKKIVSFNDKYVQTAFIDESQKCSSYETADSKPLLTSLAAKLINVALTKFLNLDRELAGIEMEAGKPGWNDALNGLPGLFGSSVADGAELLRLLKFVTENCLTGEIGSIDIFNKILLGPAPANYESLQETKDALREKIYLGLFKKETLQAEMARPFFESACRILEHNLKKNRLPQTYSYFNVFSSDGKKYEKCELPLFLEGIVKSGYYLTKDEFSRLHAEVKKSDLYDAELKIYKTSADLEKCGQEIGRIRQFTKGWLERESCFMHMDFKYLLMLLKKGLYTEYYNEIKHNLPCFFKPEVYGRSVFENSSFIATSNNPEKTLIGRGFYARLTGANVEVLNMINIMTLGHKPFYYENGELYCGISPVVEKSFFNNGEVDFYFYNTKITILNNKNINTYEALPAYMELIKDSAKEKVSFPVRTPYSEKIRDGFYDEIKIHF